MKTITKFLLFVTFVAITTANAQEVLVVDPGIGTLNTAIDTYGGDRIYQLQAGAIYKLLVKNQQVVLHQHNYKLTKQEVLFMK